MTFLKVAFVIMGVPVVVFALYRYLRYGGFIERRGGDIAGRVEGTALGGRRMSTVVRSPNGRGSGGPVEIDVVEQAFAHKSSMGLRVSAVDAQRIANALEAAAEGHYHWADEDR